MSTNEAVMPKEISQALATAQAAARAVEKRGWNDHQKFKYASAEDVIAEGREALAEAKLALLPLGGKFRRVDGGIDAHAGAIGYLDITYRLIHAPTGQFHDMPLEEAVCPVQSQKGGWSRPLDKAIFAARTEGLGYLIRELLLIPRQDAPNISGRRDADEDEPRGRGRDNGPDSPRQRREPEMDFEEAVRSAVELLRGAAPEARDDAKKRGWALVVGACGGDTERAGEVWKARVLAALRPAQPSPSTSSPSAPTPPDGVPPVLAPEAAPADPLAAIVAEARAITGTDGPSLDKISDCVRRVGQMRVAEDAKLRAVNDIRAHREGLFRGAKP